MRIPQLCCDKKAEVSGILNYVVTHLDHLHTTYQNGIASLNRKAQQSTPPFGIVYCLNVKMQIIILSTVIKTGVFTGFY